MHPYLHLLVSRSYFNLIYIEGQIIHRFNNFKTWTATHHPALHTHLTLDTFIALDDYVSFIIPRYTASSSSAV
jgi:hypothetical protein